MVFESGSAMPLDLSRKSHHFADVAYARGQAHRRERALRHDDPDEGAIIEQAVETFDHTMSVEQLTTLVNKIESVVLNRAWIGMSCIASSS